MFHHSPVEAAPRDTLGLDGLHGLSQPHSSTIPRGCHRARACPAPSARAAGLAKLDPKGEAGLREGLGGNLASRGAGGSNSARDLLVG